MPNTYFRFRQFTVQQERAAMKVCTDACLFGAWTASIMTNEVQNILDIGAGTGLLSLMVAQKSNAEIDAVEIDEESFGQASENFLSSPWADRLHPVLQPVQEYLPGKKYDLIISNPPFYSNDLHTDDDRKNAALHGTALTFNGLLNVVSSLSAENGKFAVLLPYRRSTEFEMLATNHSWNIERKVTVKQTPEHRPFRSMYMLSKRLTGKNTEEIIIKDGDRYTKRFYGLLKDYYLFEKEAEYDNYGGSIKE